MRDNLKQNLINFFLFLAIVFVFASFYLVYIAGPNRAYEKEDRLIVEAMMTKEGYKQASILSRFSFDKIYYITKVEIDSQPAIVWFDKDFESVVVEEYYELSKMYEIADQYAISHDEIAYGVFNDELVYVLKTSDFEAFFRADDLQIVYHLGSEF